MQLNYSYLKMLKLKLTLFLVTLFCAYVTWWQHFTTLVIRVFSLPFFVNAKSTIFVLVCLKSPLNWPKIQNDLLLQNNHIVKRGNFVIGIKIFTWNNLIISIVLIWYLPVVDCYHSFLFWCIQDNFFCKWFKFCYCVLYGTSYMFDSTE